MTLKSLDESRRDEIVDGKKKNSCVQRRELLHLVLFKEKDKREIDRLSLGRWVEKVNNNEGVEGGKSPRQLQRIS